VKLKHPLRNLVVVGGLVTLFASTLGRAGALPAPKPLVAVLSGAATAPGIDKIKHIVIIDQENRSFDHYFGMYPGADGIPVDANGIPTVCVPDPNKATCVKPFHDPADSNFGGPHGYDGSVADINGGAMDGFISRYETECRYRFTRSCGGRNQAVPDVMGYKLRADIPNYWAYADNFVLQDHMFEPLGSYSLPSHLALVSGWSALCSAPPDPLSCRNEPAAPSPLVGKPEFSWTDITDLLYRANVSWAYYVFKGTEPDCQDPNDLQCVPHPQNSSTSGLFNPLPKFDTVIQNKQTKNVQSISNLMAAAHNGTLPAVSWVVPTSAVSEHPQALVSDGQKYVTYVVNQLMNGPDWNSTAIFLQWDDFGGFYDHLNPPKIDQNGYGIRVPSLVISPYAKQGYIDHQTYSFDAYLRFIEDRFLGGARLDPATDGRPDYRPDVRENAPQLGDLRNAFDFTQPPRPPLILPTVASGADLATPLVVPTAQPATTAQIAAVQSPVTGPAPLTVSFDGTQSTDSSGPISGWQLDFGDGSRAVSGGGAPPSAIEHTYASVGSYTAVLSLRDAAQNKSSANLTVYVSNPVAPRPTWLTGTPINGFSPQAVTFDASQSGPGNWSIDFGDGTNPATGSGTPPAGLVHTYANPGAYTATLTVTGADSSVTTAGATSSIVAASLPIARTRKAAQALQTAATLEGHVTPNAATADYWFEWGPSPALGNSTPVTTIDREDTIDLVVNGLAPATKYYYRIVATNYLGTSYGAQSSFTTTP
jgi:phospholipase C